MVDKSWAPSSLPDTQTHVYFFIAITSRIMVFSVPYYFKLWLLIQHQNNQYSAIYFELIIFQSHCKKMNTFRLHKNILFIYQHHTFGLAFILFSKEHFTSSSSFFQISVIAFTLFPFLFWYFEQKVYHDFLIFFQYDSFLHSWKIVKNYLHFLLLN